MYLPTPSAASAPGAALGMLEEQPPDDQAPRDWYSLIGIITAIVGNILISLALNVQRYAHIRLHRQRAEIRDRARQALKNAQNGNNRGAGSGYGTVAGGRAPAPDGSGGEAERYRDDEADESEPLARSFHSTGSTWTEGSDEDGASPSKVTTSYLRSPYWWLGQVLITVGEMGNFLAYGFAPASIVSPLGVVALISNCVIAPILFKEVFRKRDFWGVVVAVAGAVTVVLSANQKETKLDPHDVWQAITTTAFEVYMGVTAFLIVFLMWASPRYGNRTILIDLGLVGLFGGYTALSTKGVSSMLSSTLLGAFTTPVTYALIFILLATAVMQVRYVNKALQRFDSTQVIPIQFVMFTLCVIIGSAILYGDFEHTTAEQAVKFVGGCLLTFFGVFLITSGRPAADEEDGLSDAEGVEETIGLAEQDPADQQASARQEPYHDEDEDDDEDDDPLSRRSSRVSRVSFSDPLIKPLTHDSGGPTLRVPAASTSRSSVASRAGEDEPSPLRSNPWRELPAGSPAHPGMGPKALSSDSAVTIHSAASAGAVSEPATYPSTPPGRGALIPELVEPSADGSGPAPHTPRTPLSRPSSHHFSGTLFSPSPLSTAVSAVVADKLLKHMDGSGAGAGPAARRGVGHRRSRPSLRASLFVSQDELDDALLEAAGVIPGPAGPRHGRQDGEEEGEEGAGGAGGEGKASARRRARSLSNTLSDFFGAAKRRPKTANPTPNPSWHDEAGARALGAGRADGDGSTETL